MSFLTPDKDTFLAGIAAAKDRTNHTGTQSADTVTDGTTNKAYTATEKAKLAAVAAGATVNRTDAATDTLLTGKADLVGGLVPTSQIPALALTTAVTVASQAAMLALTSTQVQPGDVAVRTDGAGTFILTAADPSQLSNWTRLNAPTDVVTTVNGKLGAVVLSATDVGADAAGAAAAVTLNGLGGITPTAVDTKIAAQATADAAAYPALNTDNRLAIGSTVLTPAQIGAAAAAKYPSWAGTRVGTFERTRSLYLPAGASLRKTKSAFGLAAAGLGLCRIVECGDSTTAGYGAARATTSRPARLQAYLTGQGYTTGGTGVVYAGANTTTDSRVTFTGFTQASTSGLASDGRTLLYSTASGQTATFTSDVAGTVVRVWYLLGSGAFTVKVDALTAVTVTPAAGTGIGKYEVTGMTNATHTVLVTTTTATETDLIAFEVAQTTGLTTSNLGVDGQTALYWTGTDARNVLTLATTAGTPTLLTYGIGINDLDKGVTVANFKAQVLSTVTTMVATGADVLLTIENNTNQAGDPTGYRSAVYDIADSLALPLLDYADALGSYTAAAAAGVMNADGYHPNAGGYFRVARLLGSVLAA